MPSTGHITAWLSHVVHEDAEPRRQSKTSRHLKVENDWPAHHHSAAQGNQVDQREKHRQARHTAPKADGTTSLLAKSCFIALSFVDLEVGSMIATDSKV